MPSERSDRTKCERAEWSHRAARASAMVLIEPTALHFDALGVERGSSDGVSRARNRRRSARALCTEFAAGTDCLLAVNVGKTLQL